MCGGRGKEGVEMTSWVVLLLVIRCFFSDGQSGLRWGVSALNGPISTSRWSMMRFTAAEKVILQFSSNKPGPGKIQALPNNVLNDHL